MGFLTLSSAAPNPVDGEAYWAYSIRHPARQASGRQRMKDAERPQGPKAKGKRQKEKGSPFFLLPFSFCLGALSPR
jgi:hypothetical protein